jgi:tetratricopeptide (TPR) repeat protein
VTVQELSHPIPQKALKEAELSEKARIKNNIEEMIKHLQKAIAIDPEFVAARNNLAVIRLKANDPAAAVEELNEAVKINPHHPILFKNLALSYSELREFEAAERAARLAVDLDRTNAGIQMVLGLVLIGARKFNEEAIQCFERAASRDPIAHLFAARVLMSEGDTEKAKSEINTYLSSGDQRNREAAIQWLNRVTLVDPLSDLDPAR